MTEDKSPRLSIGDVHRIAFQKLGENFGAVIRASLVFHAPLLLLWILFTALWIGLMLGVTPPNPATIFAPFVVFLVLLVASALFFGPLAAGLLAVALDLVDGRPFRLARCFEGFHRFLPAFEIYLLLFVCPLVAMTAVLFGLVATLIRLETAQGSGPPAGPPVLAILVFFSGFGCLMLGSTVGIGALLSRFVYAFLFVVDRSMSAAESLIESFRVTRGSAWPSFWLMALCYVYVALAPNACCLVMLFTTPLAALVVAAAYRDLERIDAARQAAEIEETERLAQLDAAPATDLDSGPERP